MTDLNLLPRTRATETLAYVLANGDLIVAVNQNGICVARQRLAAVPTCQGWRWQATEPTETSHARDCSSIASHLLDAADAGHGGNRPAPHARP